MVTVFGISAEKEKDGGGRGEGNPFLVEFRFCLQGFCSFIQYE